MQKIFTEERSHIFVKEPKGSSEKILKYVKFTYGKIFVPNPKQNSWFVNVNVNVDIYITTRRALKLWLIVINIKSMGHKNCIEHEDYY